MDARLPLRILAQPDDTTCGPTCLHALYGYYGDAVALEQVVAEVRSLEEGGTLAAFLACHALRRGYRATMYTYDLQVFDPTWFSGSAEDGRGETPAGSAAAERRPARGPGGTSLAGARGSDAAGEAPDRRPAQGPAATSLAGARGSDGRPAPFGFGQGRRGTAHRPVVDLRAKLRAQAAHKADARLEASTDGYLEFLDLGGRLYFEDLTPGLVRRHLLRGRPILTGLSATYLYHSRREHSPPVEDGDVRGQPSGHFVILCGYDPKTRQVVVADPLRPSPLQPSTLQPSPLRPDPLTAEDHTYAVGIERVLGAILLGILTYDANLLILEPPGVRKRR